MIVYYLFIITKILIENTASYPMMLRDLTLNLISEFIGVFILGIIFNYLISQKYRQEILPIKTNLKKQIISNLNNIVILVDIINKNASKSESEKYSYMIMNFKNEINNYALYTNILEVNIIGELQNLCELLDKMNSTIIIRMGISEKQFNDDRINILNKINDIYKIMTGNYDEKISELVKLLEE